MPDNSDPNPPPAADPYANTVPADDGHTPDLGRTVPYVPSTAVANDALPRLAGRCRLADEIGRGGMGAVLKGHDPDLDRDLAVKVLLPQHQHDPDVIRRFLEEARIGGRLQHPGVVPVYDVGRFPDQRPYFTMKLVEGRTLADLLARRDGPGQDLPRFLKVFEQVCQTVGYAHARGIIHRDLKPSNVMVGAFGEVQVMDWGLAAVLPRAVGGAEAERPAEATSVLGTPAYMPPEQARGEGEAVAERSDVFGIGAVLCEILTGAPPYGGRDRRAVLDKATRADLADAWKRLEECGADDDLVRLAKACLAADRGARPRDAGAVAEAVTAYLVGVQERLRAAELARAAAQARAAAEYTRRRLTVALATAVLGIVLVGGGGWLWVTLERAQRLADQATVERDKAARREETARKVNAALQEAAGLREQAKAGGANDLSRWAQALAAARRAEGLLAAGEVDDDLSDRVRALLTDLELEERDRRMLARLEEARLQQAVVGKGGKADNEGSAAGYAAAFQEDMHFNDLNSAEAAERINRRAIRLELIAALIDWANVEPGKATRGRLFLTVRATVPDAEEIHNRWNAALVARDRKALTGLAAEPETLNLPPADLASLANSLVKLGATAEALALLREGQRRHGDDFWINFNLAYYLAQARPPDRAEVIRFYTAALASRPNAPGAWHNLGLALFNERRMDEAAAAFRKALELRPDFAPARCGLGDVLRGQGKVEEALAQYRQAVLSQPLEAGAHNQLGVGLDAAGRPEEALAAFRRAVVLDPLLVEARGNLGTAFVKKGREVDALAEFEAGLDLRPNDALLHCDYGSCLRTLGREDAAVAEFQKAIRLDPTLAQAHYNLGAVRQTQNLVEDAILDYRRAAECAPDFEVAHRNLGAMLRTKGLLEEAIREGRVAVGLEPKDHLAHFNLANALKAANRLEEALAEYHRAIDLKPDFAEAHVNLGRALEAQGRFAPALASLLRGHELGVKKPNWSVPSDQWVKEAKQFVELDARLPAILRGEAAPFDGDAGLRFANLCYQYKRLYAAAAKLFAESFALKPGLAADVRNGYRLDAARAAARAGCGQGDDADDLDAAGRARWRNQALDWLRADLDQWRRLLDGGAAADRKMVRQTMLAWQRDADLACVRDVDALAKQPAGEQEAWCKLWADVNATAVRASGK